MHYEDENLYDPCEPRVGGGTPWGEAQTCQTIAEGMVLVTTAAHGGVRICSERDEQIPLEMRRAGGWYEEDCERWIVYLFFEEELIASGFLKPDHECMKYLATGYPEYLEYFATRSLRHLSRPKRRPSD